jgi:hypothetical protein
MESEPVKHCCLYRRGADTQRKGVLFSGLCGEKKEHLKDFSFHDPVLIFTLLATGSFRVIPELLCDNSSGA